jgi:hypothetical protein
MGKRGKNSRFYAIKDNMTTKSMCYDITIGIRASIKFQNLEVRDIKISDIGSHIIYVKKEKHKIKE